MQTKEHIIPSISNSTFPKAGLETNLAFVSITSKCESYCSISCTSTISWLGSTSVSSQVTVCHDNGFSDVLGHKEFFTVVFDSYFNCSSF